MKLTSEQIDIIQSSGNCKITAVAGSGKTTTILEYAKSRPKNSRILYLAFNKSVKLDAIRKFKAKGISNVTVETAHSLAFKHIVPQNAYRIRSQGYQIHELVEILKLTGNNERHTEYIIANHISKFISYFCNSDKKKVQDLNYLDIVKDAKAKIFVRSFYDYIVRQARIFLGKMDSDEIEITHDFYLKKFQLSEPVLLYDYILFDEAQDASPTMLDVFLRQDAIKVIVGDSNQQIYSWRYAVNSLEKADFQSYQLSSSFRFGQEIADLAMQILKWKEHIAPTEKVNISGLGHPKSIKTKAVIARTNLGLLLKAIEYVRETKVKKVYFEGNINSYTYADDGASLYDVLSLMNGRKSTIKDKLIRGMRDMAELEEYVEKTEDMQLGMMMEIVQKYGNEIPHIIRGLKALHVENDEREKAEVVFSTVHRCKGMEYDSVYLVSDFINEESLKRQVNSGKDERPSDAKLFEEINLLYVAITRAKYKVELPETLVPREWPSSAHIVTYAKPEAEPETLDVAAKNSKSKSVSRCNTFLKSGKKVNFEIGEQEKAYSVSAVREKHKSAYGPWTAALDEELTKMYCEGKSPQVIAKYFGRSKGAIVARVKKLELAEMYNS